MSIPDWDKPDPIIDEVSLPEASAPHPKALIHFSVARFLERIAHYGTRSFLVFYFIDRFGQGDVEGNYRLYGILAALVVFAQIPGGLVVDLAMGRKTAVTWGGLALAVGYFVLAVGLTATDMLGFALIFSGMGLYGPAMFTSLRSFYDGREPYLIGGMSYHFAALNAGAAASLVFVGWLGGAYLSWRQGFMLCGIAMMLGHVYLLVVSRAFGESRLVTPPEESAGNGEKQALFPSFVSIALILVFGLFWIFYSSQYRLFREWVEALNFGFDILTPMSLSLTAVTVTVLFLGGMVLTARPSKPIRMLGKGFLVATVVFSGILGGIYLSRFSPGLELGLFTVAAILIALAFIEFMVVPALYACILATAGERYPNLLVGFATAASYLPSLGLFVHDFEPTGSGISSTISIIGAVLFTLAGYWLIKSGAK